MLWGQPATALPGLGVSAQDGAEPRVPLCSPVDAHGSLSVSFSAAPPSWDYTLLTLIGFLSPLASKVANTHNPESAHPLGQACTRAHTCTAALGHLATSPFFRCQEPVVFLPHAPFWGAHHPTTHSRQESNQDGKCRKFL